MHMRGPIRRPPHTFRGIGPPPQISSPLKTPTDLSPDGVLRTCCAAYTRQRALGIYMRSWLSEFRTFRKESWRVNTRGRRPVQPGVINAFTRCRVVGPLLPRIFSQKYFF